MVDIEDKKHPVIFSIDETGSSASSIKSIFDDEAFQRRFQAPVKVKPLSLWAQKLIWNKMAEKEDCAPLTPEECEEIRIMSKTTMEEEGMRSLRAVHDFICQLPERRKQHLEDELKVFTEGLSYAIPATRPPKPR